jgi:hypothetical protein
MSAIGGKADIDASKSTICGRAHALPPKADIDWALLHVRFVPLADMLTERRCQNQYSALSASPTVVNLIGGLFASFGQL